MKKYLKTSVVISVAGAILSVAVIASAQMVGCPIVTAYMNRGGSNDSQEVTRLQSFLKDREGADVEVNGTFDDKTETAVKVFQKKFETEILTPWNASEPSGLVYVTTSKKVNQLGCNEPLALDQVELAVISDYVAKKASGQVAGAQSGNATNAGGTVLNPSNQMAAGQGAVVGTDSEDRDASIKDFPYDDAVSGNLGGGTMIQRFWTYIANLFR